LALQPEQRAAAGILRRADADLAIDLPTVKAAELFFVHTPLIGVTLALYGFAGGHAGTTGEQGDQTEYEYVAQLHKFKGSRRRSGV
jgi:hypothetical protein